MTELSHAADAAATLARVGVFGGLDTDVVATIVSLGRQRSFAAAATVLRQGEHGASIHVIVSGRVRVLRHGPSGGTRVLAELDPGEAVGEMGLLSGLPRSATVVAIEDTATIELDADAFAQLAQRYPHVYALLSRMLGRRLRKTSELVRASVPRSLARSPLLRTPLDELSAAAISALLALGRRRCFAPEEALIKQGDPSVSLLFIVRGLVRVERTLPVLTVPVTLAELGPGEFVGEMGVIDGGPRSATVTAMEPTEAIEVDLEAAIATLARFPELSKDLTRVLSRSRRTNELVKGDEGADH